MLPRPSSITVLIVPLILSTFPPPRTWVTASVAEAGYCAADQPSGYLSHASPTGYLPSPPLVQNISNNLVSVSDDITASSICPLPAATFPCENQTTSSPWPLEQGICGAPLAAHSFVYSYRPFRFDVSSDDGNNTMLFPEILPKQTYDHPDHKPSYDLCTSYRAGSMQSLDPWVRLQLIASCNEYYTPESDIYYFSLSTDDSFEIAMDNGNQSESSLSWERSGKSRKMLRGNDSTTERNLPVLDRKQYIVLKAAAIAVSSALLGVLCTIAALLLWRKRNQKSEVEEPVIRWTELYPSAPRRYSHHELAVATRGFADEVKIGRGGFGPVYRGYMGDLDLHVAIKVLSQESSVQGAKEFDAEVRVMTGLRHRNIVQLLGWCEDGPSTDLLLVYEFVPNGSLDKHLYDPQRILTWSNRYKVALGVGSAILYLHTECEQCVVHGDIKPANIMLDTSCNAKLGDFGQARFIDHDADPRTTQVVAGTLGYIDPEFVNSRRPSAESDVYSFGVVLLEMACGRRPTTSTQQSNRTPALVNWVRDMYRRNSILGAADRRLDGEFDERQMKRVLVTGLWCTHQEQSQRPSITQAMDVLRREDAELPVILVGSDMQSIADAVRSLEETAYADLSGGEDSPGETEYHTTSEETTYLPARE